MHRCGPGADVHLPAPIENIIQLRGGLQEVREGRLILARLLAGKRVKLPFYVFASQGVIDAHRKTVDAIEKSGAKVYADTCMVVSPVMERYRGIMVNSGKALAYVPDMCGGAARIGTTEECVKVATE